ncbi:MAG: hypothetical protein WED11_09755 [Natronospirillum sp.]
MLTTLLVLGLLAFVTLLGAVWVIGRKGWLKGFLVGVLGIALLTVSVSFTLLTVRLTAYEPLSDGMRIGTLTVINNEPANSYRISMLQDRKLSRYDLMGDTWRVSGRLLSVPAYVLLGPERKVFVVRQIRGRFQNIEQELGIFREPSPLSWYEGFADRLLSSVFSSEELHSALLPMASEAIFYLELRANALRLVAVNEPAADALEQ